MTIGQVIGGCGAVASARRTVGPGRPVVVVVAVAWLIAGAISLAVGLTG